MLMSALYPDAKLALSSCDEATVFKRTSDAIKTLADKALFDCYLGEMDFCVYDGLVTLPTEVGTVLAVSVGGSPSILRDEWYGYHIGGSGHETTTPVGFSDMLGTFCLFRDPPEACYIVAELAGVYDNNKKIRLYGWDTEGKRIFTTGPTGALEDGFLVPTIYGTPIRATGVPAIAKIERVVKDITTGFVKLVAIKPSDNSVLALLANYRPDETSPRYRRIRVPEQQWIRVKYRKRDIEIRSQSDWINIENRQALILALKAIKFRMENDLDNADKFEASATRLMHEEDSIGQSEQVSVPQIIDSAYTAEDDSLFYER